MILVFILSEILLLRKGPNSSSKHLNTEMYFIFTEKKSWESCPWREKWPDQLQERIFPYGPTCREGILVAEKHEAVAYWEFILFSIRGVCLQLVVHLTALKKKENILLFTSTRQRRKSTEQINSRRAAIQVAYQLVSWPRRRKHLGEIDELLAASH